jgi:cold shock CspA family protein
MVCQMALIDLGEYSNEIDEYGRLNGPRSAVEKCNLICYQIFGHTISDIPADTKLQHVGEEEAAEFALSSGYNITRYNGELMPYWQIFIQMISLASAGVWDSVAEQRAGDLLEESQAFIARKGKEIPPEKRVSGIVKKWNPQKRHGIVRPSAYAHDVHLLARHLDKSGITDLLEGETVSFDVKVDGDSWIAQDIKQNDIEKLRHEAEKPFRISRFWLTD